MAEVILFRPNFSKTGIKESRPPAGLLYVSAPLVKHGYEVAIIDQSVEDHWRERLLDELNAKTLGVGITCLTGHMISGGIKIAELVRQYSGCPVVWGGVHPSLEPDTTIASEHVDIIVSGEGEETALELVGALQENRALEDIDGIIFKKNGAIHRTRPRAMYDLNNLPPLPFHLVDFSKYYGNPALQEFFNFTKKSAVSIETSRDALTAVPTALLPTITG